MKTNRETANAFVHGMQADGSNLRTDGIILVSYYTVIGTRAEYYNTTEGREVIFLCRAGYSNTTRKHKAHVYSIACRDHYKVIEIAKVQPYGETDHATNIASFNDTIEALKRKADRARKEYTKAAYLRQADREAANMETYKRIFKLA